MSAFSQPFLGMYRISHKMILRLVERTEQHQFEWHPAGQSHSIAYELWHLARWADHLHSRLPVMTVSMPQWMVPRAELWQQEQLARAWNFPEPGILGHDETGMYMADDTAASLPMPEKAVLLDYARRAFSAAEQAVAQVPEDQYLEPNVEDATEKVFDVLLSHLHHEGRHLGMMEELLGIQGERGTASG